MEIVRIILSLISCGLIVACIYTLQKWNVKWRDALHLHIEENNDAKELVNYIQGWPAMEYYYLQWDTGIAKVYAKYFVGLDVCIKQYCTDDAAYNRLCAEELVEKLNQRI